MKDIPRGFTICNRFIIHPQLTTRSLVFDEIAISKWWESIINTVISEFSASVSENYKEMIQSLVKEIISTWGKKQYYPHQITATDKIVLTYNTDPYSAPHIFMFRATGQ